MFLFGVAFGATALVVIALLWRLVRAWANPPLPRHWLPHMSTDHALPIREPRPLSAQR